MRKTAWRAAFACAGLAAIGPGMARAQGHHDHMLLPPGEAAVEWRPGPHDLPRGTRLAVLAGDPGKPGPFVPRVRFAPDTVAPPHRHATAENPTVLSGDVHHGTGETLDKERGERLAAGAFVHLPGMAPHSVWTAGSEAVAQVTGTGPFGLIHVNPADDPSEAR